MNFSFVLQAAIGYKRGNGNCDVLSVTKQIVRIRRSGIIMVLRNWVKSFQSDKLITRDSFDAEFK